MTRREIAFEIVKALTTHGPLEGDVLANYLDVPVSEARRHIEALEQRGVVYHRGYTVALAHQSLTGESESGQGDHAHHRR